MNQKRSVLWFVILTVLLSIGCYFLPAPAETISILVPVVMVLIPAVVSLLLTSITEGTAGLRQLFARRNSGVKWLVTAILLSVVMRVAVLLLGRAIGIPVRADLSVAGTWFVILGTIPLAYFEELGWRRFALERMLQSYSPFSSALWLGLPWSVIHLILLLPGMMAEGAPMIPQTILLLSLSVILTWAYVHSSKSLITVTLLHGLQNGLTVLNRGVSITEITWLMMAAYLILAGLIIVLDRKMFFSRY